MPWTYKPEDACESLPSGEYDAVLAGVDYKQSKAGNEMAELRWTVYSDYGERTIKDYITNPKTLFRLRQVAVAMRQRKKFDTGEFQLDDHIGERIRVKLKVEQQAGYSDQNKIDKYLEANGKPLVQESGADIPF